MMPDRIPGRVDAPVPNNDVSIDMASAAQRAAGIDDDPRGDRAVDAEYAVLDLRVGCEGIVGRKDHVSGSSIVSFWLPLMTP